MIDNKKRAQFIDLPGFRKVEAGLEARGKPSSWIFETVDPENKHAFFLKSGKPWYRSACPFYTGYWLHGGCGSVQCEMSESLVPGLQWDLTCSKNHMSCPLFEANQLI